MNDPIKFPDPPGIAVGDQAFGNVQRRYLFKLYPTAEQVAVLNEQRAMIADLWNALLDRYETIQRRTTQRQIWYDEKGHRHVGVSVHSPTWESTRYKHGERVLMEPTETGRPKSFTAFDMKNEVTYMLNVTPEWRELSVWSPHRTVDSLARAIEAFYRRAHEGAGSQSGYPRFKRRDQHESIPHRFASGCKLVRRDPENPYAWRLRLKGVPGEIRSRGTFPAPVLKWAHADILWRGETWWISVSVEMPKRRVAGRRALRIEFDLLDCFARLFYIDESGSQRRHRAIGYPEIPPDMVRCQLLLDQIDELKAERDTRWPLGMRRSPEEHKAFLHSRTQIAKLSQFLARVRRNALHVWSARIIEQASDITIIAPDMLETRKTPRGNERAWGANVAVVSDLNRHVGAFAPGMAIQFLKYKAEEAGIRCDVIEDQTPKIGVGQELVVAGKEVRRAKRKIRELAA